MSKATTNYPDKPRSPVRHSQETSQNSSDSYDSDSYDEIMTQQQLEKDFEPSTKSKAENKSLASKAIDALTDFASLSSLLRLTGCIALLVSMSMFLLQGWESNDDLQRFLTMIGQTTLLGFAGLGMVKLLKETKSARLFFGLALVSISANFTTLGALIYSVFSLDGLSANYSNYALWQASSGGGVLLATGAALLVLIPFVWFGFSVLARPAAKRLTISYVSLNLLLLIPVRELTIVAGLIVLAGFVLFRKGLLFNSDDKKTKKLLNWGAIEGKFAHMMLLLPPVIMVVRSAIQYEVTMLSAFVLSSLLYAACIYSADILSDKFKNVAHSGAILTAWASATALALYSATIPALSDMNVLVFALTFSGLMFNLYRLVATDAMRVTITWSAIIFSLMPVALVHLSAGSWTTFSHVLAVAGLTAAGGKLLANRALMISSVTVLAFLPIAHFDYLLQLFAASGWLGFAIGGALIIVIAALLERYGAIYKLKLEEKKAALEVV